KKRLILTPCSPRSLPPKPSFRQRLRNFRPRSKQNRTNSTNWKPWTERRRRKAKVADLRGQKIKPRRRINPDPPCPTRGETCPTLGKTSFSLEIILEFFVIRYRVKALTWFISTHLLTPTPITTYFFKKKPVSNLPHKLLLLRTPGIGHRNQRIPTTKLFLTLQNALSF